MQNEFNELRKAGKSLDYIAKELGISDAACAKLHAAYKIYQDDEPRGIDEILGGK